MMRYSSDLKGLKWQILHGSVARNLVLKGLLFMSAMGIIPLICRIGEPYRGAYSDDNCTSDAVYGSADTAAAVLPRGIMKYVFALSYPIIGMSKCGCRENVTLGVFKDLISDGLIDNGAKAISVGEGSTSAVAALKELGFTDPLAVYRDPFFSPLRWGYVYELELELDDNSYDFVFSRDLDRVSVPALLVLEIERILRPGGVGSVLVKSRYLGGLIRSATPVSAFLKSSDVLNVRAIEESFSLVSFKKRFDHVASLQHYRLPEECQSVMKNQPILEFLEPVVDSSAGHSVSRISYLPEFMNISSRNRLIYINVAAGEFINSSIHNSLEPLYPTYSKAHHVYVIDHNVTALTTYVNNPGISFIYYPELSGNVSSAINYAVGELGEPVDNEGFDFVNWFKETVAPGDLVVLAMNAGDMELKLLLQLYESGDICLVDELFLHCSPDVHCKSAICGECSELFQSLRNSGIFTHQWFGG